MSITAEEREARQARKTNERPGVRAVHRNAGMSATKARAVLDLIRGKSVAEARTILQFCDRGAAEVVVKVLDSAVANAGNNNDIPPEELFVATAYADEGPTMKRWRPRARGRATRIRKRTCHITIIVGRYSVEEFDEIRRRQEASGRRPADAAASRARRVAKSKKDDAPPADEAVADDAVTDETAADEVVEETTADEAVATETEVVEPEAADDTETETEATDADAEADTETEAPEADETEEKDD